VSRRQPQPWYHGIEAPEQRPAKALLVPQPPQINGRPATPHEITVLARAYEAARQRDIRMLEITSSNQR
jgi:hypothetical protein